jgi:hypothetical protein
VQVLMRLLQSIIAESPLHLPATFATIKALLTLKPRHEFIPMKMTAIQCAVYIMSQVRAWRPVPVLGARVMWRVLLLRRASSSPLWSSSEA